MNRFSIPSRLLATAILSALAACGGGGDGPATPAPSSENEPVMPAPSAAPVSINLVLSGAQEAPPNASAATGNGTFTIDSATRQFSIAVATAGMTGTMAHIHDGPMGVAGPILFPMTENPAGSGTWTTSGQLTEQQNVAFLAGRLYVNVHSATFPGGEVRAQILPPAAGTPPPVSEPSDGDGY